MDDGISSQHTSIGYKHLIRHRSPKGKEPAHSSKMATAEVFPTSSSSTSLHKPLQPPQTTPPKPSSHHHSTPSRDVERGRAPFTASNPSSRHSRASQTPNEIAWGPSHPCFPHPNPHVPPTSALHAQTRIIRIRRDWMIAGDLAPTFSNVYPEILEPWVSEQEFRILVRTVNDGLVRAFAPAGWRAWIDAALGVATGWLWEDFGAAGVKDGVRGVEGFIERWNGGRDEKEGDEGARVVPLRRTGYLSVRKPTSPPPPPFSFFYIPLHFSFRLRSRPLNRSLLPSLLSPQLDIQIPDPHVGVVDPASSRSITRQSTGDDGDGGAS